VYERLTVVGATGAVGRLVLRLLEEREFPYETISFLASARSAGKTVTFKGREHSIEVLGPDAFREGDLVIASTPDDGARVRALGRRARLRGGRRERRLADGPQGPAGGAPR
jgi:aspartate-semialdehyde dehydrogenase